jgi:hypothetical protein
MAHHPHHVEDRFCGLATMVFCGLGTVVFCEQWFSVPPAGPGAVGGTPTPPIRPVRQPPRLRMIAALGTAGASGVALAVLGGEGVPLFQRAMVGAMSAFLAVVAGWACWKALTGTPR